MCTATWWQGTDELLLLFNRDERHTRPAAKPPRVHEEQGRRFLAPVDPQGGGTWIAVNEKGLICCLLNYYGRDLSPSRSPAESRGMLVMRAALSQTIEEVEAQLVGLRPGQYQPFHLLSVAPGQTARQWTWDGQRLEQVAHVRPPVTTSSWNTDRVLSARQALYAGITKKNGTNAAALDAFHSQYDPFHGAQSVCMARDDARTVSFSRIRVGLEEVRFLYRPRHKGAAGFAAPVVATLSRAQ